ncbi:MAG: hypothetical protein N3D20_02375 [Candidatus Pacearchaeota archaeon]|nr:hypothetical protein [Candidatus Pacearchaeota archaeon]
MSKQAEARKATIFWNLRINPLEQNARYYFAIFNDEREIEKIKTNLLLALGPIDDYLERKGKINNLPYLIMALTSWKEIQDWRQIHKGNIKKEPRLYERTKDGIDGLERYVINELA